MDEFAEMVEELLPPEWSVYDPEMSPDFLLEAPCGNVVEQDGTCCCPERHVSPLRSLGLI